MEKMNILMVGPKSREYIIKKVKAPLRKALIKIAERYPEPTRENCANKNSHILLAIRDEFREHERNQNRIPLLEAVWKILICEYEHDVYYRARADWVIEQIKLSDWKPNDGLPNRFWR